MLAHVTLALTYLIQDPGVSAHAVQQIVLDSYDSLGGVSCEYEGRAYDFSEAHTSRNLGPERQNFSGIFAVGSEQQSLAYELFLLFADQSQAGNNLHQVMTVRAGKLERLSEGPHGNPSGEVGVNWAGVFDDTGYLDRVMPINSVRCYFKDKNYETKLGATEVIDGHVCQKVDVNLKPELARKFGAKNPLMVTYWFDLERGAHPLKIDVFLNRPAVLRRVQNVVLRRFSLGGKEFWLPLEAKSDWFNETGATTWTEYYQILPQSVKVSQLPADRFRAKFSPGTPITDQVRRARYEFGQDLRPPAPTRAEAEKRLVDYMDKADAQKGELDASRAANDGPGWAYPAIIAATVISLVVLLIRLLRRQP